MRTKVGSSFVPKVQRCEDCRNEIPENRLRYIPDATRCVTCQENYEAARAKVLKRQISQGYVTG